MYKEYKNEVSPLNYIKNYFKIYIVSIFLAVIVLFRTNLSDLTYKDEIFWGFLIGFPILLLIGSIIQYFREKDLKYIFTDDAIIVNKKGIEEEYLLKDITDISRPKVEKLKKTGIDYIKFKFKNDRKIKFVSTLPYFSSLDKFLVQFLKEKLDYIIRRG